MNPTKTPDGTRDGTPVAAGDASAIAGPTDATQQATQPAREKYPHLRPVYDDLVKRREAIERTVAPLRAERDKLVTQIQPLENQLRAVNQKIKAATQPDLADIDNQIGALAKAMGGKSLSTTTEEASA